MSHTTLHQSHEQRKPASEQNSRNAVRAETDRMLRDIAFVLKMTQRVRQDMETPAGVEEPALV